MSHTTDGRRTAAIGVTAASVAATVAGVATLSESMRVHWTLGAGPYYGPETLPTTVVLAGLTLAVAATALGGRWVARVAVAESDDQRTRRVVELTTAATASLLVVVQLALVAVNVAGAT